MSKWDPFIRRLRDLLGDIERLDEDRVNRTKLENLVLFAFEEAQECKAREALPIWEDS